MTLSATEIGALVQELATALAAGWIQKITQPLPELILLEIRVPGRTQRLLCSAQDGAARIHLVQRAFPNPPTPPSFCRLLRARIQGARIDGLHHEPNDRIVRLHVTTRDGPATLVAELFGRQPDLLFLNRDGVVVAGLRRRADRIGKPYQPPLSAPTPLPSTLEDTSRPPLDRRDSPAPTAAHDDDPFPLSARWDAWYRERDTEQTQQRQVRERETLLRKTLKKHQRLLTALRRDLEQAGRYEPYARYGELLKANLGAVQKGSDAVTLVDYYDERLPELTIPLDPAKSAQANMDGYFSKYRKYLSAQREVIPRIQALEAELTPVHTELQAIQQGTWQPPVLPAASSPRIARRRPETEAPRGPFRRFVSADGRRIFVGRNARENDALTFGLAKSDDLWLHARGVPGSHVVVRLEKGTEPPPETLRDAATLALLYSDLKKSGKGDVIYTRRKWVKKAKGQAAGAVIVTQEKSLHVALDKRRLEALKDRARTAMPLGAE